MKFPYFYILPIREVYENLKKGSTRKNPHEMLKFCRFTHLQNLTPTEVYPIKVDWFF